MRIYLFIIFLLFTKLSALEVLYELKEPYVYKKDGKITGPALSTVLRALKQTDLKYTFKNKTFQEQIKEIKANKKKICAIAWEKKNTYEKFAKYSKAIYQDKPLGIITQRRHKFENRVDIAEIIESRKYKVLVKKDFPYSKKLTNVLDQLPKKIVHTKKDHNLVTLVAKKKGDFAFIPYADAMKFIKTHKYRSRIKFVELSGIESSNDRYMVCSLSVSDNTIEKINNLIK